MQLLLGGGWGPFAIVRGPNFVFDFSQGGGIRLKTYMFKLGFRFSIKVLVQDGQKVDLDKVDLDSC